jgi:hypothetical protein
VGLASVASVAHFLGPGRHAFNNPVFSFVGFRSASEPHMELHSKHRLFVQRGQVALALCDVEPLILEPGLHSFNNSRFSYHGTFPATAPYLHVGSMHRIFCPAGSVALIIDNGVGCIEEATGVHIYSSATFEFAGLKSR